MAPAAMAPTAVEYLDDTYKCSSRARVVAVTAVADDDKMRRHGTHAVVLDRTIFYPQGGGQPSDIGRLYGVSGGAGGGEQFRVNFVRKDMTSGVLSHYGVFVRDGGGGGGGGGAVNSVDGTTKDHSGVVVEDPQAAVAALLSDGGAEVLLAVNEALRRTHARLHSGGHLLDEAVAAEGYAWVANRGYHFPAGTYVEYCGDDMKTPDERAAAIVRLQSRMDAFHEKYASGGADGVQVVTVAYDDVAGYMGHAPPSYLPADGTPIRLVRLLRDDGLWVPCSGTHVRHVREIGRVEVYKIKLKKPNLIRVSYRLAAPP